MKKLITYNVNGIRAALRKGFLEWINKNDFDIICLQEIKAHPEQLDLGIFEHLGYQHFWFPAEKKGYSGVAVLTRVKPGKVMYGMGIKEYDKEGRVIRLDFGDTTLINAYFPSGSSGDIRQDFKMKFLNDFYQYIQELKHKRSHLIITGDFNICHMPIDIHDPVGNKNSSGFLPEERTWLSKFMDSGFIDTFRFFNKEPHKYSWWTYRYGARERNLGWRIDYNMISTTLKKQLLETAILSDVYHSDHCPVYLKIIF